MTSALSASFGTTAGASFSYALTVANNGGTPGTFGFNRLEGTNPGAISPIGTLKGVTIEIIRSSTASEDLIISLAGIRAQNFWRMIVIQTTAGAWRTYLSSAATYSAVVNTTWSFGSGSSPVFTSTTSPRGVIFYL